ncbi:HipA N-terminal domain-containing protein [Conexibacter sp. JD483]|uniref:HipA N-terminal domain-containing protein n=1 Tax=unclassified Conexibacter TaxID=2627773 RepID=UPI0027234578|nr:MULTISPECIES: HipA N-terminal domain-containing protein [unclassified Conexibacter]MDO8187751.1 HipA N-terminal domain-containing protein [Conexibacter sp. CPCC 205706]MDO8201360.1 HipA N-terminal domain-containing protein [Conexibacter sp. CPCC 205762]MDR9372764.1 HipA N-terminal domain-containing protein [Conexibacter sp. JD483]
MSDQLTVLLDDAVAGTLERDSDGGLGFTYDDEYASRLAPTPLSLSLPTEVRRHGGTALEAWLWASPGRSGSRRCLSGRARSTG